ncbi:MAG: DUF6452 family protein [Prevotella sp.]|nr:DUF6452 family protein [Prevotella sp.]
MRRIALLPLLLLLLLAACSTLDCPMNNQVALKCKLSGPQALTDTLTLSTNRHDGNDTVLINRLTGVDSLLLPMSYAAAEDTFFVQLTSTGGSTSLDTLTVSKTNEQHFESVDCNASVFHYIESVSSTHHIIDSVKINNRKVNYDTSRSHLIIFFK